MAEEYRKKLKKNVHRMLEDVAVDEVRLAQEVAFFAERSDITEEIVRIRTVSYTHLTLPTTPYV